MPITTDMMVRVAHADVAMEHAFYKSLALWHRLDAAHKRPRIVRAHCEAVLASDHDMVVIDGDCRNRVLAPEGGLIHIYGDLASTIVAGGFHEIVVTGDVGPDAAISSSGFCHVFVGGRFRGELRSSDSTKVWIESDVTGAVATGRPHTEIYIGGDYRGRISPLESASLLSMTVGGFASHSSMVAISRHGYTQFHASVARGDVPPGIYPIYPEEKWSKKQSSGNSFNRWCVMREA